MSKSIHIDGKDYRIQNMVADLIEGQRIRIAQLEADNARLREALARLGHALEMEDVPDCFGYNTGDPPEVNFG